MTVDDDKQNDTGTHNENEEEPVVIIDEVNTVRKNTARTKYSAYTSPLLNIAEELAKKSKRLLYTAKNRLSVRQEVIGNPHFDAALGLAVGCITLVTIANIANMCAAKSYTQKTMEPLTIPESIARVNDIVGFRAAFEHYIFNEQFEEGTATSNINADNYANSSMSETEIQYAIAKTKNPSLKQRYQLMMQRPSATRRARIMLMLECTQAVTQCTFFTYFFAHNIYIDSLKSNQHWSVPGVISAYTVTNISMLITMLLGYYFNSRHKQKTNTQSMISGFNIMLANHLADIARRSEISGRDNLEAEMLSILKTKSANVDTRKIIDSFLHYVSHDNLTHCIKGCNDNTKEEVLSIWQSHSMGINHKAALINEIEKLNLSMTKQKTDLAIATCNAVMNNVGMAIGSKVVLSSAPNINSINVYLALSFLIIGSMAKIVIMTNVYRNISRSYDKKIKALAVHQFTTAFANRAIPLHKKQDIARDPAAEIVKRELSFDNIQSLLPKRMRGSQEGLRQLQCLQTCMISSNDNLSQQEKNVIEAHGWEILSTTYKSLHFELSKDSWRQKDKKIISQTIDRATLLSYLLFMNIYPGTNNMHAILLHAGNPTVIFLITTSLIILSATMIISAMTARRHFQHSRTLSNNIRLQYMVNYLRHVRAVQQIQSTTSIDNTAITLSQELCSDQMLRKTVLRSIRPKHYRKEIEAIYAKMNIHEQAETMLKLVKLTNEYSEKSISHKQTIAKLGSLATVIPLEIMSLYMGATDPLQIAICTITCVVAIITLAQVINTIVTDREQMRQKTMEIFDSKNIAKSIETPSLIARMAPEKRPQTSLLSSIVNLKSNGSAISYLPHG